MKVWCLVLSVSLFCSCATTMGPNDAIVANRVSDEFGIRDALMWYAILAAAPSGEEEVSGIDKTSNIFHSLIGGFVEYARDITEAKLSPDVISALGADHRSLCGLFGIDTASGLEVDMALRRVQIVCQSELMCGSTTHRDRAFRDLGRPPVDCVLNKGSEQPEAFVELTLILAPANGDLSEEGDTTASMFKIDRRLHLVKGESWGVISDR